MADREELTRVVLDVSKRSLGGGRYKDEALVETLLRHVPHDEHVRLAFVASRYGYRTNCLLICTDSELLIIDQTSGDVWRAEAIPYSRVDAAEMVKPSTGGSFWEKLAEHAFRDCELHIEGRGTVTVTAIDAGALQRLVDILSDASERRAAANRAGAQSIHIGSVNRGNVSVGSSHVRQRIGPDDDVMHHLDELRRLVDGLRSQMPRQKRDEVAADIDALDAELSQPVPNKRIVNLLLGSLERLPQFVAVVDALRRTLGM